MRFRRLHEGFGAEVIGFDVVRSGTAAEIEELRAAYDEYQMLMFRCDRRIAPEHQVEISSWFGPVCDAYNGTQWYMLQNEDPGGTERLPFHSDLSYTDSPLKGISLQAVELPRNKTSTAFVSGIHAWATLRPHLQQLLAPMTLLHKYVAVEAEAWPEFLADHPVRLLHPRTGQPILYVTEHHAQRIHELDPDKSKEILAKLFAHLYAPGHTYEHRWSLYDFLIWDNLAIQHARPERAEPENGARALQRVMLCELPFGEIIERSRQQEKQRQLQVR